MRVQVRTQDNSRLVGLGIKTRFSPCTRDIGQAAHTKLGPSSLGLLLPSSSAVSSP